MVILGLGTNMGEREALLERTIAALAGFITDIRISPVYMSPALLAEGAPEDWNRPFLNMALAGNTKLDPQALLAQLKQLEKQFGRQDRGHWAPREMDIDILAYADKTLESKELTIPHPLLLTRDFALVPLADVAPDWKYPVKGELFGKTAKELVNLFHVEHSKTLRKTDVTINLP